VRAVATTLSLAATATVAVPSVDIERARSLVGGPRVAVIAAGARRSDTLRALVAAASARWLLLHDIVHPFVTATLAAEVLARARESGTAAAVLPNVDFLYGRDGLLRAGPGEVVAVQKPVAFRRETIVQGLAVGADRGLAHDAGVVEFLALAGAAVAFVPGHPTNIKLTTLADLELARALVAPARPAPPGQ
jgi:2-C-methyl-D-erythritol 4-phosphate cytidylyltransferase